MRKFSLTTYYRKYIGYIFSRMALYSSISNYFARIRSIY